MITSPAGSAARTGMNYRLGFGAVEWLMNPGRYGAAQQPTARGKAQLRRDHALNSAYEPG